MTDTNLVTISRLDIYDLLHNQAVKMDKEKEFLDQFVLAMNLEKNMA